MRVFLADRGDAAHRLDRVLVRRLADIPGLSRTSLQGWIAEGRVRVNGAAAIKPAERLALGDEVEVSLPPSSAGRPRPAAEEIPLTVLYEDGWLLALSKPPGMVVHPAPGHRGGTLLNALLWYLKEVKEGGGESRPSLANRLDRGTSGVLLAAKSGDIHARLAKALRAPTAAKEYLALVYGTPRHDKGRIEHALLRDSVDTKKMTTSRGTGREGREGRPSVTLYEILATAAGLTLLRCRLLTGRMHQIRVHCAAEGFPLVGDPLYGEPRWKGIRDPALAAACRDFPRQALHAHRIALTHPVTREPLDVTAPLPDDLLGLLAVAGLAASGRSID